MRKYACIIIIEIKNGYLKFFQVAIFNNLREILGEK